MNQNILIFQILFITALLLKFYYSHTLKSVLFKLIKYHLKIYSLYLSLNQYSQSQFN